MNKLLQLILCLTLLFPAYSRACALDYQPIAIISELAEGNKCRNATFSFDGHWSYDPDDIPDGHNPSQHPGAGIVSYSWTFGDGSTGSGATTSHTYTAAGTYAIRLTVRDNEGNTTWTETWVYVYEVAAVLANGVITTGETFYAALPHLDEPSSRVETYICDVWALANPGNYWFPSCFYWSPGGGGLPRIYPDDCWGAGFYAKDHGTVTITATCGNSTKSMQIAIEGIDLETTVPAAEEISKAYNIFVNENYDQGLEEADLPGHAGCLKKDCSDLTLSGDSSDEIGEISLNLQLYGDNQAQVKLNYDTDSLHIFKNDSLVQSGTWYPANTLEGQLQVEGAYAGSATVMATLKTQDGQQTSDIIWIKTVQLNLTAVWPAPLNDGHEICHRDKMIIQVNNNDSDLDGLADNDPADTLIDLPGGDPDMATITLSVAPLLSASDIDGSVLLTIPSNLKAWKNKNKSGGTAAAEYNLSELPVTLYLEGLQPGGDILDTLIKAEMTLNSGVKCRDELRYTVMDFIVSKCPQGWMPQGGNEDNGVTLHARILPDSLTANIKFTLYETSNEPGFCLNRPATIPPTGEDSASWKDLQFAAPQQGYQIIGSDKNVAITIDKTSLAYININCYDYGAYSKIKAEMEIGDRDFIAHAENDYKPYVCIPYDEDENHIADCWAHNTGNAEDDFDTSLNNTHNGDGLTRYEEYRGVDIDMDGKVDSDERLSPLKKDLFVKGEGFDDGFAFGYGDAFTNAGIKVHDFKGVCGVDDRNIDVLRVFAFDTHLDDDGHLQRHGRGDWRMSILASSSVGKALYYGVGKIYRQTHVNLFEDKPYVDGNTKSGIGQWNNPPNGVLDPFDLVEDADDDGELDPNEKDGINNPPTNPDDDGDDDFDGDYPVKSSSTWEWDHDLSPLDVNNNGLVEVDGPTQVTEWGRDDVRLDVITHEIGHGIGITYPYVGHCVIDPNCIMYYELQSFDRRNYICDDCKGKILIHNN